MHAPNPWFFYLHQSSWGGYWTPIPKGSCPTATQDLCAPKPTLGNKYKTSKYRVTAGLQEWQVSHLHWRQGVLKINEVHALWNVAIWSSFSLFALNWYQTSKSSVRYTCTNNQLWFVNGGNFVTIHGTWMVVLSTWSLWWLVKQCCAIAWDNFEMWVSWNWQSLCDFICNQLMREWDVGFPKCDWLCV